MNCIRALKLFLGLVWREYESKKDFGESPCRAKGRISWADAWNIAWGVHSREVMSEKDYYAEAREYYRLGGREYTEDETLV